MKLDLIFSSAPLGFNFRSNPSQDHDDDDEDDDENWKLSGVIKLFHNVDQIGLIYHFERRIGFASENTGI